jgi:heme A synthase
MNRLFARLLVIVVMGLLAVVARAAASRPAADPAWMLSATPCAQCP